MAWFLLLTTDNDFQYLDTIVYILRSHLDALVTVRQQQQQSDSNSLEIEVGVDIGYSSAYSTAAN